LAYAFENDWQGRSQKDMKILLNGCAEKAPIPYNTRYPAWRYSSCILDHGHGGVWPDETKPKILDALSFMHQQSWSDLPSLVLRFWKDKNAAFATPRIHEKQQARPHRSRYHIK
jgi:hypothetical protein